MNYFQKAVKGNNNPVYYLLTSLALFVGYFVGQLPLIAVAYFKTVDNASVDSSAMDDFITTMDFNAIGMSRNLGFFLMILMFVVAMLTFMLCVRHLHKRPFKNLITGNTRIDWNKILFGFGLWFVLALIFEGIVAAIYPERYFFDFKPMSWIILLLISVLFLPIQTSLEELFMRGYLMPGIAFFVKNKWVPLLITSIFFGFIHGMNPEVERFGFWTMQLYYVGAGLFLGLITIFDDSLELALGVHAATNIFGAAFFSFEGSVLQTDSLVKATEINPYIMSLTFLLGAILFIIICKKKYQWGNLNDLLLEKLKYENHKKEII